MTNIALLPDGRSRLEHPSRIDLMKGALWTRRASALRTLRVPLRVSCDAGCVWVTREGDPGDVVLCAGSSYGDDGRGLLVVEALEKAQISVSASGSSERLRDLIVAVRAHWRLLLALAAVYLIWGSTYFAIRIGLETLPPLLMAGARFVVAGLAMYATLRLRGAPRPSAREWGAAARVGVLLLVCGNGFIVVAQQWVSSGVAAVVVSTMPLWAAVFTSLAGRVSPRAGGAVRAGDGSQISRGEWLGLVVGFAGAALLQLGGDLRAAHAGALLVVLAPICWAFGSVYSRSLPLPSGAMGVATEMLAGGAVMLALSPIFGERLASAPSLRSLLAVAYLIVFGSIIAFSAYMFLLKSTRPAIATSYAYVNPLVAIGLGVALGGEQASATTWTASAVIAVGVLILSTARAHR